MNYNLGIRNFRIFDNTETTFEIKPITLLTGCNSSGKSSLLKSLMLLSDFFQQLEKDYNNNGDFNLQNHKLDFTKKQHQNLGNFSKVLNYQSGNEGIITFSYRFQSLLLAEDVIVDLSFKGLEKDELNNGWLSDISFKKKDGEIFYSAKINEERELKINFINLSILKSNFMDFAVASCGYSTVDDINTSHLIGFNEGSSEEVLTKNLSEIKEFSGYINLNSSKKKCFKTWHEDSYINSKNKNRNRFIQSEQWELIKKSLKQNTIFCLPVFEWVENTSKSETRNVIENKINDNKSIDQGVLFNINKILTEFENSEFNRLIDYFIAKEIDGMFFRDVTIFPHRKEPFLRSSLSYTDTTYMDVENIHPISFETVVELYDDGDIESNTENIKNTDNSERIKNFENRKIDFRLVYTSFLDICLNVDTDFESKFNVDVFTQKYNHPVYFLFQNYLLHLLNEAITPNFLNDIKFVGSTRANVQRLYSFDNQGTDFKDLLLKYFEAKKNFKSEDYTPDTFMNEWIKRFEIGDSIRLKTTEEGLGVMLYLFKNSEEKNGHLLADEGYGITQLISLLLQIETAILEAKIVYKTNETETYSGPRFSKSKVAHYESCTLTVEEPEIHLHPKLQSLLADMFLEAYQEFNIHFIVETHSEYLIRKTQVLVSQSNYSTNEEAESNSPFITYYLPKGRKPYSLRYRKDGKFAEKFGEGFYDEATNLTFEIL